MSNFMKFCHCLFKMLKNQNVADDKHTDNMKTVYPQQTQFAGGYNNWHNFAFINMSYSLKSGTLAQILKKKNNNRIFK